MPPKGETRFAAGSLLQHNKSCEGHIVKEVTTMTPTDKSATLVFAELAARIASVKLFRLTMSRS